MSDLNEFVKIEKMSDKHVYDVIIIGAGLSGLSAGYYLKKNHKDISLLVLEAKDRVGGRTQTIELNCSKDGVKKKWDAGGQWVTDTQTYINELINEFGMKTYKQFDEGTNVLETNGKMVTYKGQIPRINPSSLVDLQLIMSRINRNAAKVDTVDPFSNADFANENDNLSIGQLVYKYSWSQTSRSIIEAAIRTIYGLESSQINSLFGLMYVNSGYSIESLALTEPNCAQEKRVKGGTQQISQRLLDTILSNSKNSKAYFKRAIVEINQEQKDQVVVKVLNLETNEEEIYFGKKLVSAIPINQYKKINFVPELPFYKRNVFYFCKPGNYIKIIVTYREAFWRKKGYSGAVVSDGSIIYHQNKDNKSSFPKHGPYSVIYDGTTDEDEPAIVGFSAANAAVEWTDQDSELRKNEVIQALVRYFGPEAADYVDYFEKNWSNEPYNGGCPTLNVVAPDVMQDYARATREPFINMHMCSTESATRWQGYMDGAVESGQRAAYEILHDSYKHIEGVQIDYKNTYYYQRELIERVKPAKKKKCCVCCNTIQALVLLVIAFFVLKCFNCCSLFN